MQESIEQLEKDRAAATDEVVSKRNTLRFLSSATDSYPAPDSMQQWIVRDSMASN